MRRSPRFSLLDKPHMVHRPASWRIPADDAVITGSTSPIGPGRARIFPRRSLPRHCLVATDITSCHDVRGCRNPAETSVDDVVAGPRAAVGEPEVEPRSMCRGVPVKRGQVSDRDRRAGSRRWRSVPNARCRCGSTTCSAGPSPGGTRPSPGARRRSTGSSPPTAPPRRVDR